MTKIWKFGATQYDTILTFGDKSDRVIETVGKKGNGRFELGYYNGDIKPKAIINISPAVGCSVGCNFCDLTDAGLPLSAEDMLGQVVAMAEMVNEIDGIDLRKQPLKVNIAKTGEPSFNKQLPMAMRLIAKEFKGVSFKYSTSAPRIPGLIERVKEIAAFAAEHKDGSVQLQVSLISTDEAYRLQSARPGMLAGFSQVREVINAWRQINPNGRTANCSLLIHEHTPCDPEAIKDIITPDLARFRTRKIISTSHSDESGIVEATPATIQAIIEKFKSYGYHISDAGIPTPTEAEYSLASNVTRRRLGLGLFPKGIIENPVEFSKTGKASWAESLNPEKRRSQNQGPASIG